MNVPIIMEDVLKIVLTLLVAMSALVVVVIILIQTNMLAMVFVLIKCVINYCYFKSDINECTGGNHDCDHTCYNTIGSYECDCHTGYVLDTNELNCIGK